MREQIEEMRKRIDQLETVGKVNELASLEQQIDATQTRLGAELRRKKEMETQLEKSDRQVRELTFQTIESKKDYLWMEDLVDNLQQKMNSYQLQLDEAHAIATENLKKFELTQKQLEESRKRAEAAEEELKRYKNRLS